MLHTFQEELAGSHNDLHLGNLMIKLCDDTLFNNRPLNKISHWEYKIGDQDFRLPNLGFLVKVIDFGLSSVSLQSGMVNRRFALNEASPLWNTAFQIVGNLSLYVPNALHQRWATAERVRQGLLRPALDLQTVCNHLTTHPFYHRNTATIAAEEQEYLHHFREEQEPKFEKLSVMLFSSFMMGDLATARVPKSLEIAKMTPKDFLLSSTFSRYKVECENLEGSQLFSLERFLRKLELTEAIFKRIQSGLQSKTLDDLILLLRDFPTLSDLDFPLPQFAETKAEQLHGEISEVQEELSRLQQNLLSNHPIVRFEQHPDDQLPTEKALHGNWALQQAAIALGKEATCIDMTSPLDLEGVSKVATSLSLPSDQGGVKEGPAEPVLFFFSLDELSSRKSDLVKRLQESRKKKAICVTSTLYQEDDSDNTWIALCFDLESRRVWVHHPQNKKLTNVVRVCEEIWNNIKY